MKDKNVRCGILTAQYAEAPKTEIGSDVINSVPLSASNKKAFDILSSGDGSPFEFVQEVKFGDKYPATDGTIFDKSYADSYSEKANSVPIPGSAYGHTALHVEKERVRNHVYVTAAKVVSEDTMLLRHYVSNKMDKNDYDSLVSEIKAGLISTSLFGLYKYKTAAGKDGTQVVHAIKSVGKERNDLVEWDQTGMASKMIATSQKDVIDEYNEGDTPMDLNYDELIAALKDTMTKNRTDHVAVMKDLGLNIEVLTAAHKADLAVLGKVRQIAAGGDVEQIVTDAVAAQGNSFATLGDAAIEKEFGHDPELKKSVSGLFGIKVGSQKDIAGEIDRLKGLDAIKIIAAKNADGRQHVAGGGTTKGKGIQIGSNFKESK